MIWLVVLLMQTTAGAGQTFSGPPQAKRGYDLYFDTAKATACGNCHAIAGKGTAVGPDLKKIARIPPKGFATAVLSTITQYVVAVKPKTGEAFPGMTVKEDDKILEVYDLSKTPPELRKLERSEVESTNPNTTWKHPPLSVGYTNEQLADVIAYIKWAAYRHTGGVDPADLE